MIYLQLFLSFLQIGAFSFGGGYAAMPLIQAQVVDLHHWLSLGEFTDLVTISQMTPGPIFRRSLRHLRLHPALLHYRIGDCLDLHEIQEDDASAGSP